jgi:Ca2+-binding EF-hand superfamily protein
MGKKKFIEIYKGFFPEAKAEKFCNHLFKVFDEDNSGAINFEEFVTAVAITSDSDPLRKIEFTFKLYDSNKNGAVCLKELQKMIEAMYRNFFYYYSK